MEKGMYKKDFDSIEIYSMFLGIWWHKATINREMMDDGMELFKKTKEHYRRLFGYETRYKLVIKRIDETHDTNGIITKHY